MKRIKDEYLNSIEAVVPLFGKTVLEVGCGNGARSVQIAKRCAYLTAMEPNIELLDFAKDKNSAQNIAYVAGKAERLGLADKKFDVVLFTLSFHHVPAEQMVAAIDEAVRVSKKGGHIIFLEPTEEGNFFDSEIAFDACDGDERQEKRIAYNTLKSYSGYREVKEMSDETVFNFDSLQDFMQNMMPKKNIENLEKFLKDNDYTLRAARRINIFKV